MIAHIVCTHLQCAHKVASASADFKLDYLRTPGIVTQNILP